MTVQIGDYMKALYDFPEETSSDLSFSTGDIIKVTDTVDGNWAVGHKVGMQNKTGTFPLAYVERVTLPSARTGQKVFLAIEDFPAGKNEDLELSKGDIVLGLEPVNDSWWRGKNGPLKGIFPLSMVDELELHDGLRSRSASACSSSLKMRSDSISSQSESGSIGGINGGITKVTETTFARALVDVTPQLDGELGFQLGDLIEITEILDDDWFYGKCHNSEGLVSAVCVEILMENGEEKDYLEAKFHQTEVSGSSFNSVSSLQESVKGNGSQNVQALESRTGTAVIGSYTSENTRSHDAEVTPYGRVIYPFNAQISTELSLAENSLVTLIKHVDSDWTEGEVDGRRGLFPTNFIEIIVDCPYTYNPDVKEKHSCLELSPGARSAENANIEVSSNIKAVAPAPQGVHESGSETVIVNNTSVKLDSSKDNGYSTNTGSVSDASEENHEIGLVLFNFVAEVTGDVSVKEGDTVEVIKPLDENWLKIQTEHGQIGQAPRNFIEIIGPWPKAKSSEVYKSARVPNALTESFHGLSRSAFKENKMAESTVTSTPETNVNSAEQSSPVITDDINYIKTSTSTTAEYNTSMHKPNLTSRGKPPLLPKPALSSKPIIASKPSSVITHQSYMPTRNSSSSNPKTTLPLLENKKNSFPSLDALITEEISKAKNSNLPTKIDNNLSNSDHLSAALSNSNIPIKKDIFEQRFSNSPSVSSRETSVSDHGLGSTYKPSVNATSTYASFDKSASTVQFSVSPINVDSEGQEVSTRRNIFSHSMSVSLDSNTILDSNSRRKSASYAEQKISIHNSTFVNKAFEMDTPEGILVNLNGKNNLPSRPSPPRTTPPRPVSAILSSTTHAAETPPGKMRRPPPRPTGPRMAAAPSKTPLMPIRVESPVKFVPRRPAPKAPGIYNQINHSGAQQSTPHLTQPTLQHPPRPPATAPKRPPPRPADLISFSPERSETDVSEEATKELVADLKSKLEENRADIKKFEQTQSDLQKNLVHADSQEKKAETKDNLEFVERQLCGLQEEECKLKENLFALSPHEARLEKARLLSAQHAEEEEKRKEEEKKKEAEMKEKRRDQRAKVIKEILETEKDFLLSLQLCLETFLDGQKPAPGVDLIFLLGNMEEIADVSQKMVIHLETCTSGKNFDEQHMGKCFTYFAEDMKNTYAPYCRNHDDVITAMERYTESTEINDYFNAKIEKMREQMNVFDVSGILIKPVQRILKYPLLLNELLKNTDEDHPDREDIIAAINAMTDVAKAINEYKRRKDLVYKYKKLTDQTFSDKISKLNLHSIRKKSSRIKGRLSTNFGIGLQMRDEQFEKEEAKFRHLERAVKVFLRSVYQFLDQIQETMHCQENVVDGIKDFYKGKACEEANKLHEVTVKLLELFNNMKETVESVVVISLNTLVGLFSGPAKVIEKRFDKLLDYNYQLGKTESDKELQAAKNDYQAMNAQLLDELPKFYNLAFNILKHCIAAFVLARRDFMELSLRESCALLELPSMASKASLMETFKTRHITVFDHLSLLSFIPKGFNPRVDTIKADRAKQKGRTATESGSQQLNTCPSSQTESQKSYLQQHYPSNKLYTVISAHNAVDLMDISLTEGSMLAVIKELDPMGNKDRWFVDDGVNKGFVPSNILRPISGLPPEDGGKIIEEDLISILSCDSGDVVFAGNDDRVVYHIRDSSVEPSSQPQQLLDQQQYYALYDFTSRHPNETSLVAGHPVTVLAFHDVEDNPEWWLVESEGSRGYAPANYMAPMPYS